MLRERLKKIYFFRKTLWDIAVKELKAKYAGSILGISWAVINPLLIMSAVTFIFTNIFKVEMKGFFLFVLSGIFPWFFFCNTLSDVTNSFLNKKSILHQFNLPREIIPLGSILSNFLNFLIGWLIIYPLFLFFNPKIVLLSPLLLIALLLSLLFISGLGLIFSVANIFYRDIGQLLGVLLMFWFWITPVFYSVDMVPVKFRWIYDFNPVTPYIIYYREILFAGRIPELSVFIAIFLWAFISAISGLMVFSRLESKLLKWI